MTSQIAPVLSCAALALLVLTTSAQTQPPGKQVETVVVTGARPASPDTLDKVVLQFIDAHAARDRKTEQFVRDTPAGICPVTEGLPPALNAFVTARVAAVATSVGARTQTAGACAPNVEILFSPKPQELVDNLVKQSGSAILGVHYVHESGWLSKMTRPIQSWYVTGTARVSHDSDVVHSSAESDYNQSKAVPDDAYFRGPERHVMGSRLDSRIQSVITNVLIVADSNRVAGQEIGPISDYVAMLALSQPKSLDGCNEMPSILDLMSSGCGDRAKPEALTNSDMAYLKSLYAADLAALRSPEEESVRKGMESNLVPR